MGSPAHQAAYRARKHARGECLYNGCHERAAKGAMCLPHYEANNERQRRASVARMTMDELLAALGRARRTQKWRAVLLLRMRAGGTTRLASRCTRVRCSRVRLWTSRRVRSARNHSANKKTTAGVRPAVACSREQP